MPTISFSTSTFPAGTPVAVYPATARRDHADYGRAALPPAGAPLASGTVDANSRVSMAVTLPAGSMVAAPLVAYGLVGSEHKYVTVFAS